MMYRYLLASRLACASATTLCAMAAVPAACAQQSDEQTYDLPAQDLGLSLRAVAHASGRSIIAPADIVAGKSAPALRGTFTSSEAVALLLADSGLRATPVGTALVIEVAAEPDYDASAQSVADIVVTGTRIRGAPTASPVITIGQREIRNAGQTSLG